ncbi:MAG: cell wall-binding repeat-containing protein [Euzebya sp.]
MSVPALSVSRVTLCIVLVATALLAVPSAALAQSECVQDPAGDVENRDQSTITEFPQADILAACTDYTAEVLEVSVRVAQPTDPETDPGWADFASTVGVAVDVGGAEGEEFDVNYARFPNGETEVRVFVHDTPEVLCTFEGIYDGVRYRIPIPADCIGNPAQVNVAAFIFYTSSVPNQASMGYYDEVPPRPNFRGPFTTADDPATAVQRLAGPSRVDTAIAVSRDDFSGGAAGAVVLARADLFPDALVAAPLATAVDGPLLLTPGFAVPQIVEDEIQRVLPGGGTVYLSGGIVALEDGIRTEIEALGYSVVRAAGDSRYATAVEVARAANPDPALIVVADGNTFPDALVGGSLAAAEGGVAILSNGTQLDDTASAYLAEHPDADVLAIGVIAAQAVPDAPSIAGSDAFATSVAVAQQRYPGASGAAIASGTNFPDGLAGGAHAARRGLPLLLSYPDVLPDSVAGYLSGAAPLSPIFMYGGVVALSNQVERDAAASLG